MPQVRKGCGFEPGPTHLTFQAFSFPRPIASMPQRWLTGFGLGTRREQRRDRQAHRAPPGPRADALARGLRRHHAASPADALRASWQLSCFRVPRPQAPSSEAPVRRRSRLGRRTVPWRGHGAAKHRAAPSRGLPRPFFRPTALRACAARHALPRNALLNRRLRHLSGLPAALRDKMELAEVRK